MYLVKSSVKAQSINECNVIPKKEIFYLILVAAANCIFFTVILLVYSKKNTYLCIFLKSEF